MLFSFSLQKKVSNDYKNKKANLLLGQKLEILGDEGDRDKLNK